MKQNSEQKVEITNVSPTCGKPTVGSSTGDWLIRKWKEDCGGEYDLVRFKEHLDIDKFAYLKYYRIKNREVEDIMAHYPVEKNRISNYFKIQ